MSHPSPSSPLGSTASWLRDFALIGAITGAAAPAFFWWQQPGYLIACGAIGATLGGLLGVGMRPLLLGPFARWPFGVLLLLGLGVGAVWGGGTGLGGGIVGFGLDDQLGLPFLSGAAGAFAGALQLGWFWLPYTLRHARGRSTWPIVLAACTVSSGLGLAALALMSLA